MGCHLALEGQQAFAFSAIQPRHGPAVIGRVLRPLRRVHIHKIHQHRWQIVARTQGDVLRHHGGKNDDGVDLMFRQHLLDPGLQTSISVVAQAQRFTSCQRSQASQLG